jgi:O-antigen/teichoic acid export membrane protein
MVGRMLEVTRFGELALIQSTVLMLGNLGEAGLTLTTTKFVGRWKTSRPDKAGELMGRSLCFTAVSGVFLAVFLFAAGGNVAGFPESSFTLALAAGGLLLFDMLNRVQFGALSGLEVFREAAQIYLIRGALLLPCVWFGTQSGDLTGAVIAMAIVSLVTFIAGHAVLRRQCEMRSISLRSGRSFESGVFTTSASLWISTLLLTGSTWIVVVFLSQQPSGYTELGLFNAADRWKLALLFLPNVLFQVVLPMLSRSHEARDRRSCEQIVSSALASTVGITTVAAIAVFFFSPVLMTWYGSSFQPGIRVLALAALGSVVNAVYTVGSGVLWSLGAPTKMILIDVFKTLLLLGLCFSGFGTTAWSLTLAYLIAFSAGSFVVLAFVLQQLRMDKNHEPIARTT